MYSIIEAAVFFNKRYMGDIRENYAIFFDIRSNIVVSHGRNDIVEINALEFCDMVSMNMFKKDLKIYKNNMSETYCRLLNHIIQNSNCPNTFTDITPINVVQLLEQFMGFKSNDELVEVSGLAY